MKESVKATVLKSVAKTVLGTAKAACGAASYWDAISEHIISVIYPSFSRIFCAAAPAIIPSARPPRPIAASVIPSAVSDIPSVCTTVTGIPTTIAA